MTPLLILIRVIFRIKKGEISTNKLYYYLTNRIVHISGCILLKIFCVKINKKYI